MVRSHEEALSEDAVGLFPKFPNQQNRGLGPYPLGREQRLEPGDQGTCGQVQVMEHGEGHQRTRESRESVRRTESEASLSYMESPDQPGLPIKTLSQKYMCGGCVGWLERWRSG